jgi:hypothetical protein
VDVDAVGTRLRGVGRPQPHGLDILATAAEELGRQDVGGQEGGVDARHRRLGLEGAQEADVGKAPNAASSSPHTENEKVKEQTGATGRASINQLDP